MIEILQLIICYYVFTVYLENGQTLDFQWLKKYNINDIDLELRMMMNIHNDSIQNNVKITPNVIINCLVIKLCCLSKGVSDFLDV